LLYILSYLNLDYRFLYAKSFISIDEIVNYFCEENKGYAYFNKIPRLQNIAYDCRILKLSTDNKLTDIIGKDAYACIKVNTDFIKSRYSQQLWRDDHFLLICNIEDDKFTLVNDTPRDIIALSKTQLEKAYDDTTICINIVSDTVTVEIKEKLFIGFVNSISKDHQTISFEFSSLEIARDVLGIIRVARKRIKEYCSLYINTDFMSDYILQIDKMYAMLEYMRLRKRFDYDKIERSLSEIQESDVRIIYRIKQKMREIG
jgi:hypothetical protein